MEAPAGPHSSYPPPTPGDVADADRTRSETQSTTIAGLQKLVGRASAEPYEASERCGPQRR
jgi:hypothetical protein